MTRFGWIAVNGLLARVRVLEANPIVRFHRAIGHGEFHFGRVRKERQACFSRRARSRVLDSA